MERKEERRRFRQSKSRDLQLQLATRRELQPETTKLKAKAGWRDLVGWTRTQQEYQVAYPVSWLFVVDITGKKKC